ncbi:MAG: hypothetical protein HC908_08365 [Calothrix sp. SM1_7_51]|nr:hypothetical protein [Calothrix sp. SM1_7_51]
MTEGLFYIIPIGLSLLYVAQVDPDLKLSEAKSRRHVLRILGTSLICLQATISHQDVILDTGNFQLKLHFLGLALRVLAYLYVGTAGFLMTAIYQLVIFSLRYPFLNG